MVRGIGTLIDIVGLSSDIENTDYIISIMIIYLPIIVRKAHSSLDFSRDALEEYLFFEGERKVVSDSGGEEKY